MWDMIIQDKMCDIQPLYSIDGLQQVEMILQIPSTPNH